MSNVRTKIAAGVTVLGLGGLGGFALATNDPADPNTSAAAVAVNQKPPVRTEVVHRTIHVGPDSKSVNPAGTSGPAVAAAPPVAATPAVAGSGLEATEPVSTHTSGSTGSRSYDDDEDESESESEYGEIEAEDGDD